MRHFVFKVDVLATEYQEHEACIELSRRSTTIYNVGTAYVYLHSFALYLLVSPCTC